MVAASCAHDSVTLPRALDVRVVYQPRLPEGCPDALSLCYAMCAHHNAPAGLQAVVTLWDGATVRLSDTGGGRYEGVLSSVPVGAPLRLYGRDIAMCCVDACNYPPALHDISIAGTLLTRVVTDGLPAGVKAALEFTLRRDGTVAD
jgi:hypothetical protein